MTSPLTWIVSPSITEANPVTPTFPRGAKVATHATGSGIPCTAAPRRGQRGRERPGKHCDGAPQRRVHASLSGRVSCFLGLLLSFRFRRFCLFDDLIDALLRLRLGHPGLLRDDLSK